MSSDRKIRRVLRDCIAKQPEDATPVLPGGPGAAGEEAEEVQHHA